MDDLTGSDVTVMVCAYNAEETIAAALASIAGQSVQPGAVVVVDDASTDRTGDVAQAWNARLPIELVTLDVNGGHPHARVVGAQHCHTALIALLDADDFWLPDHLETMLATYRRSPSVVAARELLWIRGSRLAPAAGPEREVPPRRGQQRGLLVSDFVPIGTLFARADLERVGGFRDVMPEDWDLWIRIVRAGVEITRADHPTYVYRIHEGSSSFGEKYTRYNVETLERALAEATSDRERRGARHGIKKARARQQLMLAYGAAEASRATARRHALRALRGDKKTASRALFMLAMPRKGARIHERRLHDIVGWLDR